MSNIAGLKPSAITYPQPAARALVMNEEGHILLVRESAGNVWTLPGGRLDFQEKAMEAAVRELYEETGIKTSVDRFAYGYESYVDRLDWHIIHLVFHMKPVSSNVINHDWVDHDTSEITGAVVEKRFFSLEEIKEIEGLEVRCLYEYLTGQDAKCFFKSCMDK